MFVYFLIFTLAGFFVHKFSEKNGQVVIIVIAIIWGISSGIIWGLASLGEMFLGFYIAQQMD